MNMKHTLLASALVVACGAMALAPTARAAQSPAGTITFQGLVVANSCVITVNGGTPSAAGGAASGTVTLPTVFTSAFTGAGTTAGATPFSVSLSACDNNLSSAQTFWSGSNINSNGYLNNTIAAPTGSNVAVQLLNGSNAVMNLSQANATAQSSQAVPFTHGAGGASAVLNYSAQYYATAASTSAGTVNTTVQFTVIYQ